VEGIGEGCLGLSAFGLDMAAQRFQIEAMLRHSILCLVHPGLRCHRGRVGTDLESESAEPWKKFHQQGGLSRH